MTMMTSLKALLSSTTAAPAGAGKGVGATPANGAPDFAALLGGVASDAAPVVPGAAPEQAVPDAGSDPAVIPTATLLTTKAATAAAPVSIADAEELASQDAEPSVPAQMPLVAAKHGPKAAAPKLVQAEISDEPVVAAEEEADSGSHTEDSEAKPAQDALPTAMPVEAAAVITPPLPIVAPIAADPPSPTPAESPSTLKAPVASPAMQAVPLERAADIKIFDADPQIAAPRPEAGNATGKIMPDAVAQPVAEKPAIALSPVVAQATTDKTPQIAQPLKAAAGALIAPTMDVAAHPTPSQATVVALPPMPTAASAAPQTAVVADASILNDPVLSAAPAAAPDGAQPKAAQSKVARTTAPRADAASLLQFVRDHVNARAAPRVAEGATKAASEATITALPDASAVAPTPTVASPSPTQAASFAAPSVAAPDLSASLGAQVVDMGVQGQWIDGLARDIAGLSANGAQGRFQIDTQHLGPVQVAIRQDGDGAAVSLTVATKAAEDALRQDSDRLRLDAGLQAIRINEVKIERAPHVAEAARSDTQNQQQSSQQHGQQSQQSAWQASGQQLGQNANQSAQQGRWQGRENFSGSHKAGAEASVITHADAGESTRDGPRARYA